MKTNLRLFTYCTNAEGDADITECSEEDFIDLSAKPHSRIQYERHSIRENGVDQVCLTVEPLDYPELSEVALC